MAIKKSVHLADTTSKIRINRPTDLWWLKIKFLDAHRFTTLLTSKTFRPSVSYWLLWSRSHWNNQSFIREQKRKTPLAENRRVLFATNSKNHFIVKKKSPAPQLTNTWSLEHFIKCIFIMRKPLIYGACSWVQVLAIIIIIAVQSWWLAGCRSESTSDDALLRHPLYVNEVNKSIMVTEKAIYFKFFSTYSKKNPPRPLFPNCHTVEHNGIDAWVSIWFSSSYAIFFVLFQKVFMNRMEGQFTDNYRLSGTFARSKRILISQHYF